VGETYSHHGKVYRLEDSPALPKPAQRPHPPIIIGGGGPKRTPRLAAQYAAEFNVGFRNVEETAAGFERARAAARELGRDPRSLVYSTAAPVVVGRDDAEVARRAEAIGQSVEDAKAGGFAGTPGEVVAKIKAFEQIGASRVYLQVLDLADLDHLELIAAEVARQLD